MLQKQLKQAQEEANPEKDELQEKLNEIKERALAAEEQQKKMAKAMAALEALEAEANKKIKVIEEKLTAAEKAIEEGKKALEEEKKISFWGRFLRAFNMLSCDQCGYEATSTEGLKRHWKKCKKDIDCSPELHYLPFHQIHLIMWFIRLITL